MTELLTPTLLAWSDSRWTWAVLGRRRPEPTACMPLVLVPAYAAAGMLAAGLPFAVLARLFSGTWSLWAFWIPGSVGLFTAALAGLLQWFAWNRRAVELRQQVQTTGPAATARPPTPAWHSWVIQPVIFLVLVITGYLIASGLENQRGARALRRFQADLRERGEPVVLDEVRPTNVPDDRNLAMAPILKPLLDYRRVGSDPFHSQVEWLDTNGAARVRAITIDDPGKSFAAFRKRGGSRKDSWMEGAHTDLAGRQAYYVALENWDPSVASDSPARDVLQALGKFEPALEELRLAAEVRPEARFPVRYEESYAALLPHLAPLKSVSLCLALRASARLADGQTEAALSDVRLAARLSDSLKDEPLLIAFLVRVAIDGIWMQPVWEGCVDHRWSEPELAVIQSLLQSRDYLEEVRRALRGERVLADLAYDAMARRDITAEALTSLTDSGSPDPAFRLFLRFFNKGWIRLNQVAHGRYVDLAVQDLGRANSHAALPPLGQRIEETIDKRSLFTWLAALFAPALDRAAERAFEAESRLRLGMVGVALERHRLAEGRYPKDLAGLSPKFLSAGELTDPMDGQRLRYTLDDSGDTFRLYSVGVDRVDNDGKRSEGRARSAADRKAPSDVVWH